MFVLRSCLMTDNIRGIREALLNNTSLLQLTLLSVKGWHLALFNEIFVVIKST